jgi:hypothetical protein
VILSNLARSRPIGDYAMFAELWLLLLITNAVIRIAPFRMFGLLLRRAARDAHDTLTGSNSSAWPPSLLRLFMAAVNRQPIATSCLSRSLALWLAGRWRGLDATLCFGFESESSEDRLAHAWLESGGCPVAPDIDGRPPYPMASPARSSTHSRDSSSPHSDADAHAAPPSA